MKKCEFLFGSIAGYGHRHSGVIELHGFGFICVRRWVVTAPLFTRTLPPSCSSTRSAHWFFLQLLSVFRCIISYGGHIQNGSIRLLIICRLSNIQLGVWIVNVKCNDSELTCETLRVRLHPEALSPCPLRPHPSPGPPSHPGWPRGPTLRWASSLLKECQWPREKLLLGRSWVSRGGKI